ncbi:hypothetical protein IMCC26207_106126 [Actinobacteria bacterium IMCC26207]|nr:hypothetical protein IMCC26207_106126 [Actinobacteria bacterium IMCC26207]
MATSDAVATPSTRRKFLLASGISAAGMLVLASGCVAPPVPPTTTTTTTTPPPAGPNLLANPSFESDVFGSTFTNWTVTP